VTASDLCAPSPKSRVGTQTAPAMNERCGEPGLRRGGRGGGEGPLVPGCSSCSDQRGRGVRAGRGWPPPRSPSVSEEHRGFFRVVAKRGATQRRVL
jgi:hypothetical protein